MMIIIDSEELDPMVFKLLSYATSTSKVRDEYDLYVHNPQRILYGYETNGFLVGCIGIEIIDPDECEIKHIAVAEEQRARGIGKKMINYINREYKSIIAETDEDAVVFYEEYGFTVLSLGAVYPGVERFNCKYKR